MIMSHCFQIVLLQGSPTLILFVQYGGEVVPQLIGITLGKLDFFSVREHRKHSSQYSHLDNIKPAYTVILRHLTNLTQVHQSWCRLSKNIVMFCMSCVHVSFVRKTACIHTSLWQDLVNLLCNQCKWIVHLNDRYCSRRLELASHWMNPVRQISKAEEGNKVPEVLEIRQVFQIQDELRAILAQMKIPHGDKQSKAHSLLLLDCIHWTWH